ncbi:hypothetical protein I4U23_012146 [Adineta vaga]|nr:hypothetical protein I4U23_012146 [Adineta vaga]
MVADCDVVLIFIGESGSGKSTCINYFANFFASTGFSQTGGYANVQVVIPNRLFPQVASGFTSNERNVNDKTMSQTMHCNDYNFVWSTDENKIKIKVIDTPGFNDTDSRRDDDNIQEILQTIAKLPFITAIIITINGTNSRLSTSVKSTLDQLRSSLPDSVFDNLFFILTNCTESERNFDLKLLYEYSPHEQRIFHMQNSLFSVESRNVIENNSKNARRAELNWQDSMDTITDIMTAVQQTCATSTQIFNEMRMKREELIAHKENLIDKQKSLLQILNQLKIERDRLTNAQNDQEANQSYTTNKMIEKIDLEKKEYYSTICTEHGKVMVCHKRCGLDYQPGHNLAHFKNCAAADKSGNNCKHCQCGMNQHLHTYEIPVARMVEIEEIIQSKKAAFDQASQEVQTIQDQLNQLDIASNKMRKETDECKKGILHSIRELKKICSRFNFVEMMSTTIEKLRQEAKIARDFQTKQEFNNTANAIQKLIQDLN